MSNHALDIATKKESQDHSHLWPVSNARYQGRTELWLVQ